MAMATAMASLPCFPNRVGLISHRHSVLVRATEQAPSRSPQQAATIRTGEQMRGRIISRSRAERFFGAEVELLQLLSYLEAMMSRWPR